MVRVSSEPPYVAYGKICIGLVAVSSAFVFQKNKILLQTKAKLRSAEVTSLFTARIARLTF
jgi:hypothetical protein